MKKIFAIPLAGFALFAMFSGCGREAEPEAVEPVEVEPAAPVEVVMTLQDQLTEDYALAVTEFKDTTEGARNKYLACRKTTLFKQSWEEAQEKNLPLSEVLLEKAKFLREAQEKTLGDKQVYNFDAANNDEAESFLIDIAAIAELLYDVSEIESDPERDESDLPIDLFCDIRANKLVAALDGSIEAGMALAREQTQSPIGRLVPVEEGGDDAK